MSIDEDFDTLAPRAREHYLGLGRRYSIKLVSAQARACVQGLALYADVLVAYGFGVEDEQRAIVLCDVLHEHATRRAQALVTRATLRQMQTLARRRARDERKCARTVLGVAARKLLERDVEAWQAVQATLAQTRRLRGVKALPAQMETLHRALLHPAVVPVIAARGGDAIQRRLAEARDELFAAEQACASFPELQAAAEKRDILNGMAVALLRDANTAARMAARRLAQPAIAAAFKLVHLEPPRRRGAAAPGAPAEPATPDASATPSFPARSGSDIIAG
jgi:hypothetical protein